MAEDLATYDQVQTGDPDPLGLDKRLAQVKSKSDPLGLDARLQSIKQAPVTQQPKVDQPTFQPMDTWLNLQPQQGYQPLDKANVVNDHTVKTQESSNRIKSHLADIDNSVHNLISDYKKNMAGAAQSEQLAINKPFEAAPLNPQAKELESKLRPTIEVHPNEVSDYKAEMNDNPVMFRQALEQKAKDLSKTNPIAANQLKSDIYRVDAQNRPEKEKKISENVEKINNGDLDYDVKKGILVKPEGFWGSLATSFKQKTQAFDDYDVFKSGNEKDILNLIKKRTGQDPDEPTPVPVGATAEAGSMLGGQPLKPLVGAGIAGYFGGPEAGAAAMSAISAPEMYKLSFGSSLPQNFDAIKKQHPDLSDSEVLQQAIDLSNKQANTDALTGAAMGAVGAKFGFESTGLGSGLLKKSVGSALKQIGEEGAKKTLEGVGVGAIGGAGQYIKNVMAQKAGIPTDEMKGVPEQLKAGIAMTAGITLVAKASNLIKPSTYNKLLHGLSKAPEEAVNSTINDLQQQGHITPEEAQKAQTDIASQKKIDSQIPANIPEPDRLKIQQKIKERNDLKSQLETVHEAYHPDIKEKIKKIDEDILNISKGSEHGELQQLVDKESKDIDLHILRDASENDLKTLFKAIAEKAHDPNTEDLAKETFGENIVNKAKELYPKEEPKESKISVIQPGEIKQPETITIAPKEDGAGKLPPEQIGHVEVSEHGEDTKTAAKQENGTEPSKLSPDGVKEAEDLGQYLKEKGKTKIITSEVKRAQETANIAGKKAGIPVETNPVLNTWNIGKYDGKPEGSFVEEAWANKPNEAPEGGESFNDFTKRMEQAYQMVKSLPEDNHVVSHSKVMRALEALKKTDGKWAEETTKDFLTNKELPDAVQVKESLNLPKTEYGKLQTDKDFFPERSKTKPRINRETAADIIGENEASRLQASLNWLEAIERNDIEKSTNAEEELIRKSMDSKRQIGKLLDDNDRGRSSIRASSSYGEEIGAKTKEGRARSSQEPKQFGQQSGQFGASESSEAFGASREIEKSTGNEKSSQLSESEKRRMVEEVRKLSKLRNKTEKTQSAGFVRHMLEQALRENPRKTKQIIDLITENTPNYGTIRERISKEISMGEAPGNSSEMGQGIPESGEVANAQGRPIGEEASTNKGQEKVEEPRNIGITHRQMDAIAKELGLETYEKSPERVKEWDEQAAKRVKEPNALNDLFTKLRNGEIPDKVETRMMLQYMADLMAKIEKAPKDEALLQQLKRTKDLFNIAGREQGKALAARKGTIPVEETLGDFLIRDMEANKAPLTEQQKETSINEYNKIKEATEKYEKELERVRAENNKLKAEKEVKKIAASTKKAPKKDYSGERKQIIDDIREKLRKARGETNIVAVPYAKELIAIAPDVAKLVKSLVEEGIEKLPEIIKNVHGQIKELIPEITEKDIHNIIAGEYNQKKTKTDLSEKLYNLKLEAQLINKLEAKEAGIQPKNEKQKIKRNQEIESLRQKIKDFDQAVKEAEQEAKQQQKAANKKTPEQIALQALKNRYKSEISKLEEQLRTGDFAEPDKQPIKLDKEAQEAKEKLFKLKQEREVRLIKEKYKNQSSFDKGKDAVVNVLNAPRSIMSSMDYSAPLRQGLVASVAHPTLAAKALKYMFKASVSQKEFDRWFMDLKDSPDYHEMINSGLAIADPHDPTMIAHEEAFMSQLPEKIPGIGKLIKGSERAYTGFLNKMRVDSFRRLTSAFQTDGRTFENSPELYKAAADYINATTGRGNLPETIERASPLLNSLFFSPRLIASRLQLLTNPINPNFYRNVPKEVRVQYFKDMAKFVVAGATILGLAQLGGAHVEKDPRSSDFGKIKVGNTRWDIWGGFQQYARFITQIISGQKKAATSGEVTDLSGQGRFGETRADVVTRFARGKLAPVPATLWDLLSGRTVVGEKLHYSFTEPTQGRDINLTDEAKKTLLPLIYSDIKEAWQQQGPSSILTVGVPSAFGVGTQTFDSGSSGGSSGGGGATETMHQSKTIHRTIKHR